MPHETAAISFGPEGYSDFQTTFLHLAPTAGVYVIDNDGISLEDGFSALWDFLVNAERRYALLKDGGAFWRGEAALALVYNGQVDDPDTFQSDPTFSRFRWDLAPSPVFDKVAPLSYAYIGSTLVMSATSERKDEAWNLMGYLAGPDYAAVLAGMKTPPFTGSLPSSVTPQVLANLKTRADKNYESFYAHAAPKARAWSRTETGCLYVTTLLQRLVVDTVNGRIDGDDAASIIGERGPSLYSSTVRIDISNPEALRQLIGY
jgi:ABC-type glycerol-3-phosphate transport system substrate-binding protein